MESNIIILRGSNMKNKKLIDVYQIESIYFGNWFEIARNFISSESVFELIHPYRTQNKNKMSSGEKLPLCFYK